MDEKFFQMNLTLQKNNKEYDESTGSKLQDVQSALQTVQDMIQQERKKR